MITLITCSWRLNSKCEIEFDQKQNQLMYWIVYKNLCVVTGWRRYQLIYFGNTCVAPNYKYFQCLKCGDELIPLLHTTVFKNIGFLNRKIEYRKYLADVIWCDRSLERPLKNPSSTNWCLSPCVTADWRIPRVLWIFLDDLMNDCQLNDWKHDADELDACLLMNMMLRCINYNHTHFLIKYLKIFKVNFLITFFTRVNLLSNLYRFMMH